MKELSDSLVQFLFKGKAHIRHFRDNSNTDVELLILQDSKGTICRHMLLNQLFSFYDDMFIS
jgi:hypothetical protein